MLGCTGTRSQPTQQAPTAALVLGPTPGSGASPIPGGLINYGDTDSTVYARVQISNTGNVVLGPIKVEVSAVHFNGEAIEPSVSPVTLPGMSPGDNRTIIVTLPKGKVTGQNAMGFVVTGTDPSGVLQPVKVQTVILFNIVRE